MSSFNFKPASIERKANSCKAMRFLFGCHTDTLWHNSFEILTRHLFSDHPRPEQEARVLRQERQGRNVIRPGGPMIPMWSARQASRSRLGQRVRRAVWGQRSGQRSGGRVVRAAERTRRKERSSVTSSAVYRCLGSLRPRPVGSVAGRMWGCSWGIVLGECQELQFNVYKAMSRSSPLQLSSWAHKPSRAGRRGIVGPEIWLDL